MTKQKIDNRHLIRQIIIQKLYEKNFHKKKSLEFEKYEIIPEEDLEFDNLNNKTIKKIKKAYPEINEKIKKIEENLKIIDNKITEFAKEWPLEQINPVDLQILRLAIFEGFIESLVPKKVAIDEAIELARDFGNDSNRNFVSGVLGNIYKTLK